MFTAALVAAVILQGWLTGKSRRNGALLGFLVTTIILVWGVIAYNNGDTIYFSSVELSLGVFVSACIIWYLLDLGEWVVSTIENRKGEVKENWNKSRKQFITVCVSAMLVGIVSVAIGLSRPGSEQIPAIPLMIVGGFVLVVSLLTLLILKLVPKEEDAGWPTETKSFEVPEEKPIEK